MPRLDKRDSRVYNTYRVPRRQWKKWSLVAHHVFNKTYEDMKRGGPAVWCPKCSVTLTEQDWDTIAWNAAFTAAHVTTRGEFLVIDHMIKLLKDRNIDGKLFDS